MLPDRLSNPGPLTYESGALPIALRGPALLKVYWHTFMFVSHYNYYKIPLACMNEEALFKNGVYS